MVRTLINTDFLKSGGVETDLFATPKSSKNLIRIPQSSNSKSANILEKVHICNCRKTKCLKLYCECFANGEVCATNCSCCNCFNNHENKKIRNSVIEGILSKDPNAFNSKFETNLNQKSHKKGCNCKKSNCLKKYCECYHAGVSCTENCKCGACKNVGENRKKVKAEGEINSLELLFKNVDMKI